MWGEKNVAVAYLCLREVLFDVRLFGAQYPNGQARSREWMPLDQMLGQSQVIAQFSHLVLVEIFQRFNNPAGITKLSVDQNVMFVDQKGALRSVK